MVGQVPGSHPHSPTPQPPEIPDPSQGPMGEMYSAKNAPGVAAWFRKMFPHLSDKDLDKAVSGWMKNEMQFLQTLMKRLDKQRKKAMEEMKKSIQGGG